MERGGKRGWGRESWRRRGGGNKEEERGREKGGGKEGVGKGKG